MKKFILIFVSIFIAGSLLIVLPYYFSAKSKKEVESIAQSNTLANKRIVKDISSNTGTITNPDVSFSDTQTEIYDKEQIYFQNAEMLYNYFNVGQVEMLKEKIQSYIHQYINKDILDCSIESGTISHANNNISFVVSVKNVEHLSVIVILDDSKRIIDTTIQQNIK